MPHKSSISKIMLSAASLLALSGCASFRDYVQPIWPKGAVETQLAKDAGKFSDQAPIAQWWGQFNDPKLAELITLAQAQNYDIKIAIGNLQQARGLAKAAGYDRFPTITSNANYTRQRLSTETAQGQFLPDRSESTYAAGFDARWEIDLLGRVSQRVKANKAGAEAAQADLTNITITIAAEVARTYMELRGTQYRLNIAQRNADNQAETYKLTQTLSDGGRATALDVSRAHTQLSLTQARIPQLQAQVTASINRLAVLTGQVPDALAPALEQAQSLPSLPITIAVGNTSDLLQRRPDIRRAERLLAAATANYNVATTNLFPTVNIIGSLGFIATNLSNFGSSALASTISPTLSWRAFDLGRVRAEISQADGIANTALASYEQTVLTALEETQTALSNFRREEERRSSLQQAAKSAKQAADLARKRFDNGVDDFLDVLDAQRTQLEAEDALALSETTAATGLIAIYKALSGGWN